jgi:glycosyltransferase involved in cell wall biosynthesis
MGDNPDPSRVSVEPAEAQPAPQVMLTARARSPGFSFCIITHGRRPEKLLQEIASIRALQIPHYEILVGGDVAFELPEGVVFVPAVAAARAGRLGEMRNRLVEQARYDHLIVADDDLLLHPDFYQGLLAFGEDYEVMCVRLLNPDGTRFWDWATVGGPRGHSLLPYSETDPFVYVTGGLCIMKATVPALVKWDEKLGFYQGEDSEFSSRLRKAGISICFNPLSTVVHNDTRYTQVGGTIVGVEDLLFLAQDRYATGNRTDGQELLERAVHFCPEDLSLLRRALHIALDANDLPAARALTEQAAKPDEMETLRGSLWPRSLLPGATAGAGPTTHPSHSPGVVTSQKRIPVLYDASLLAEASRNCMPRENKMFQRAENCVLGLLHSEFCDLRLFLPGSAEAVSRLEIYLRAHPLLSSVPLCRGVKPGFWETRARNLRERVDLRGRKTLHERILLECLALLLKRTLTSQIGLCRTDLNLARVVQFTRHAPHSYLSGYSKLSQFYSVDRLERGAFSEDDTEGARHLLRRILAKPRRNHWFFALSNASKTELCRRFRSLPPERVMVVYPGASGAFFPSEDTGFLERVLSRCKIPKGPFFISHGNLENRGNLAHVIKCFGRLVLEDPARDLRLLLPGLQGKECSDWLARQRIDPGVERHLILTEEMPELETAALYNSSLGLVDMSLWEVFPWRVLEAMQSGAAVIATNGSSFPEVVGEGGLLLDPHDPDTLCQAMRLLCRNPESRKRIQAKAIQQAAKFNWRQFAEATLAGYAKALGRQF